MFSTTSAVLTVAEVEFVVKEIPTAVVVIVGGGVVVTLLLLWWWARVKRRSR